VEAFPPVLVALREHLAATIVVVEPPPPLSSSHDSSSRRVLLHHARPVATTATAATAARARLFVRRNARSVLIILVFDRLFARDVGTVGWNIKLVSFVAKNVYLGRFGDNACL